MPCTWPDVLGSVQEVDDGDRTNLLGETSEEVGLIRVRGRGRGGFDADALSDPERRGAGDRGGNPPPRGGPKLPGLSPQMSVVAPVPGRGVPGRGLGSDQPPGSICALPHTGHNSDPGGGEPTVPHVPPV